MKILAIDTSGKQAGAAIMDEYITIGEILINAQSGPKTWHHSEILMPAVERLFALSGLTVGDMDYVAYTSGPGSFTGIRIGAATALGLARSINRPAIPVPTLDALAYNMLCANDGTVVVPLLDARREQVYGAVYRKDTDGLVRLTDYFATSIDEALEIVKHVIVEGLEPQSCIQFLGDGADANKSIIQASHFMACFAPINANRQRPASVGLCAIHQHKTSAKAKSESKCEANPEASQVQMIYVRDPQAVRSLKKP